MATTPVTLPPMLARPVMLERPRCAYGPQGFCSERATAEVLALSPDTWLEGYRRVGGTDREGRQALAEDLLEPESSSLRWRPLCDRHKAAERECHDGYADGGSLLIERKLR